MTRSQSGRRTHRNDLGVRTLFVAHPEDPDGRTRPGSPETWARRSGPAHRAGRRPRPGCRARSRSRRGRRSPKTAGGRAVSVALVVGLVLVAAAPWDLHDDIDQAVLVHRCCPSCALSAAGRRSGLSLSLPQLGSPPSRPGAGHPDARYRLLDDGRRASRGALDRGRGIRTSRRTSPVSSPTSTSTIASSTWWPTTGCRSSSGSSS